jgi:HemY protein
MLKALWYLIKILIVVGMVVFLLVQPGQVVIDWKDYKISVQLGFIAALSLVILLGVSLLTEVVTRLSLWPQTLAKTRVERRRTKGYRTLLRSLSAAAIGDKKTAYYLAYRAQKFLPENEAGLPLLLQAQSMPDTGDPDSRERPYRLLLRDADTALLGMQGLAQNAILSGDFQKALLLARKAYEQNPKNHALARAVYEMEIKNGIWNDALVTLDKNKKFMREIDDVDRVAIYIVLGDMAYQKGREQESFAFYKKAYFNSPLFVPAVVRYATALLAAGKRQKALSVAKKAWKIYPHPSLVPLWRDVMPQQKVGKEHTKFRWFQWVAEFRPDSVVSQLALARVAIEEELWGEARQALAAAEKIRKCAEIYELWVALEEKTTNRPDVIRQWLDKAYRAPTGGIWTCVKTGRTFSEWTPIIEPEKLFNTLIWHGEGVERALIPVTPDLLKKPA